MRRALVAAGSLALVAGASFTASADAPARTLPKSGCNLYADAAGDASALGEVATPAADPAPSVVVLSEGDTSSNGYDITGVSYRLSDAVFTTVLRVPQLKQQPIRRGTGDNWVSTFTVGKRVVEIQVGRFSPIPLVDGAADLYNGVNYTALDGTANFAIGTHGQFDFVRGLVHISVDRASLERALGQSLGELKSPSVTAQSVVGVGLVTHDVAAPPKVQRVLAGDNFCFD